MLTTDRRQRVRLLQSGLAMAVLTIGVLTVHYFIWVGAAPAFGVWIWTVASLGGMLGFLLFIRFGFALGLADPSLTMVQIVYAILCSAAAYALVGNGRGAVFPILMVTIMFGMFQLRSRQVAAASALAVLSYGAVMALMAWRRPEVYTPAIELGHFIVILTVLPAVSLLAGRLSALRQRLRRQRNELAEALARIQELATQDELTGLSNRRQMLTLMNQERERCARTARFYCLAMLDLDHFKSINDEYGHAVGDAVLSQLAATMRAGQRGTDTLGRWGGEEFVLLMSDTSLPSATAGVERLRAHVQEQLLPVSDTPLRVTISCGLAQSQPGETVAQTLERADRALYLAKAQGRNRLVVAPCPPAASAMAATPPCQEPA